MDQLVAADHPAHKEDQDEDDQEQPKGRNLRRAVAVEKRTRQAPRAKHQLRQSAPDAAIDLDHGLDQLRQQSNDRAVKILAQLATGVTPRPHQRRRAVGAGRSQWAGMLRFLADNPGHRRGRRYFQFIGHVSPSVCPRAIVATSRGLHQDDRRIADVRRLQFTRVFWGGSGGKGAIGTPSATRALTSAALASP